MFKPVSNSYSTGINNLDLFKFVSIMPELVYPLIKQSQDTYSPYDHW
jgi:hypothetical protein